MRAGLTLRRIADDVFEILVADARQAQTLASALRAAGRADEVVAGLASVAIQFDPREQNSVEAWLNQVGDLKHQIQPDLPIIEMAIQYGGENGPDIEWVCERLGLTQSAFIEEHCAREHTVEMLGFTPGFSYISGVSESWAVPRLHNPRHRVGAGSVGISAGYTGIYALAGPGGWPIIGRTSAQLFDPGAPEPFLLSPAQRVKFRPV
ncbi:MAG: allophanate hydrolase subunit 1 [Pseudomonadota bacterium]